jgi:dTMP kinase
VVAAPSGGHGRGLFITLEGGEGAGKSLQSEALARRIEAAGRTVVRTREPGGTPLGERLREILLDLSLSEVAIDPLSEAVLFAAARSQLVATVIRPALERGDVVICDRFADSTTAYQGYGRSVDLASIDDLNRIACGDVRPDLTVLIDLPVAEGLARKASEEADRFMRSDESFHERVSQGYLTLAAKEPRRWIVVDGQQPPDAVTEAIWARVSALL